VNLPNFFTHGPGESWGFFVGGGAEGQNMLGQPKTMNQSTTRALIISRRQMS
jgi:hypothetical protein